MRDGELVIAIAQLLPDDIDDSQSLSFLSSLLINLSTTRHKLLCLFFHSQTQRRLFIDLFLRRVLATSCEIFVEQKYVAYGISNC